jgi:hypothetical protein
MRIHNKHTPLTGTTNQKKTKLSPLKYDIPINCFEKKENPEVL